MCVCVASFIAYKITQTRQGFSTRVPMLIFEVNCDEGASGSLPPPPACASPSRSGRSESSKCQQEERDRVVVVGVVVVTGGSFLRRFIINQSKVIVSALAITATDLQRRLPFSGKGLTAARAQSLPSCAFLPLRHVLSNR